MDKDLSFEAFTTFLSERFNFSAEDITRDTVFTEDLGIDSLSLYGLLDDVEKRYGIKLDVEDILAVNTAGKIYDYVAKQFHER